MFFTKGTIVLQLEKNQNPIFLINWLADQKLTEFSFPFILIPLVSLEVPYINCMVQIDL